MKIYIYDLPAHLQNCTDEGEAWQHFLYGAELRVPRLLQNSTHVTKDPEQADYFYVPPFFFCRGTLSSLGERSGWGCDEGDGTGKGQAKDGKGRLKSR